MFDCDIMEVEKVDDKSKTFKNMITKEKFKEYLRIRDSGVTNMFDARMVCELSGDFLKKEDCFDIMKNFSKYENQFGEKVENKK